MNPCDLYPFLRLARDADWKTAAQALAAWLQHAQMGYPCPPPDGWRWLREDKAKPELAFLCREWGAPVAGRGPHEDATDEGAVVERAEDGRWRWCVYNGFDRSYSGLPDAHYSFNPDRSIEARAATWADLRDAVADVEAWLDVNAKRDKWRDGVLWHLAGTHDAQELPSAEENVLGPDAAASLGDPSEQLSTSLEELTPNDTCPACGKPNLDSKPNGVCTCFQSAPCSACCPGNLVCSACGWRLDDGTVSEVHDVS